MFTLMSEVKFSPAARVKFGFLRTKLTAYAVSEIAASGSSDRVPQPFRLPFFFHYRRSGGNFAIHSVDNFAHGSSHEFRCPSGQFRVRACPHIFPDNFPFSGSLVSRSMLSNKRHAMYKGNAGCASGSQ